MAVFEDHVCVCEKVWDGEPSRAPAWMAELADVIAAHGWIGCWLRGDAISSVA